MEDDFMKKLLALVLVLCLASLANATTVTISGPSTIDPDINPVASYTVSYATAGDLGSFDIDVVADLDTHGTLDNVVITATARDTGYDWIGTPVGENQNGWEVSALILTTGTGLGSPLFTFDVTATGNVGDIIALSMSKNMFFDPALVNELTPTLEGMNVEIVPEPITLALLGLGGLFIRRK